MPDENGDPGEVAGEVELTLDPRLTRELFIEWRAPRYGKSNPERMNNPVWTWLIQSRVTAFRAAEVFKAPSPFHSGPGWCFDRFGQSSTPLSDGRVVFVAGEHEDYYDPDFYIYNDVVVQHSDGRVDIYGYPPEVFPPTDFHSATVVGNRLLLIGSLGYLPNRRLGFTQVLSLNLEDFSICQVETFGTHPGWIHGHTAALSEKGDSVVIRQGMVQQGERLTENIDDWELSLQDLHWRCLVKRKWSRWEVRRADGKPNHLWEMRMLMWTRGLEDLGGVVDAEKLAADLGGPPDLDAFDRLYQPSIRYEPVETDSDEHNVFRIRIDGVIVRYVEGMHDIRMIVEGELPPDTINQLAGELRDRLAALENAQCELKQH